MKENISPYTILFVEDEAEIRSNYVVYLKMLFKEVYEAADGRKAYEIYNSKKPDILILDINIPYLSGIELLKKIRKTDSKTKAIMLTAHTDTKLLLEAVSLKLTKYLVKPISRTALKEALNLVLLELDKEKNKEINSLNLKDSYTWDYLLEELSLNNKQILLTNKEKKVFSLFCKNVKKTFSSDEIIYEIWEEYDEGSVNSLKTIIKTLRRKLPKDSIKNYFGVGYKLEI